MKILAAIAVCAIGLSASMAPCSAAIPQLTFDTVFAAKPLWGTLPAQVLWSPDGRRFTYVESTSDMRRPQPIYAYDVASHASRLLYRPGRPPSRTGAV
ncbi:MAG TPA: hypothetical protein VIJ12_11430 [Candidatus Baltobacteraceae bacterium]